MAATLQNVILTKPDPSIVRIAIGNTSYDVPAQRLVEMWNGDRPLDCLLWQLFVTLKNAGLNPATATNLQMKTAIEAQQVLWGN